MRKPALMAPAIAALVTAMTMTPALAQDMTVTPGNTLTAVPAAWLGEVPHFVMMGTAGGRSYDVQLTRIAEGGVVAGFAGKREYLPGEGGTWRYGDFEVGLEIVLDGVEKAIELEYENNDFSTHPLPADFTLQGEEFPEGLLSYLEVEAEWETAEGVVNDEVTGWSGTLSLAIDTGTPDGEGLLPDGMIGGYVVAQSGADSLVISFTVPVTEYEKDE